MLNLASFPIDSHIRMSVCIVNYFFIQVFSIVIYAFRTELFSAEIASRRNPLAEDRDLPLDICYYEEPNNDIYGDRICNNTMAAAVTSMLLAIVLMIIDLHVPCTSSTVSYYISFCTSLHYHIAGCFSEVLIFVSDPKCYL